MTHYSAFAELLDYPVAAAVSHPLLPDLEGMDLSEQQEIYTRTFDLNPVCTLDIGYQLFGENYKRGEFLAHLRETEERHGIGAGHELPDHLPVILRLLDVMEPGSERDDLLTDCVLPALDKMIAHLKNALSPYLALLETIRMSVAADTAGERCSHA